MVISTTCIFYQVGGVGGWWWNLRTLDTVPSLGFDSFFFLIYFGCAESSLLPGHFSHCSKGERGLFASCSVWTSHRSGFCCRAQALGHMDFSSWGARAWLPYSMWDLPGQIERMSPALVGGLFTTEPPGKPWDLILT